METPPSFPPLWTPRYLAPPPQLGLSFLFCVMIQLVHWWGPGLWSLTSQGTLSGFAKLQLTDDIQDPAQRSHLLAF